MTLRFGWMCAALILSTPSLALAQETGGDRPIHAGGYIGFSLGGEGEWRNQAAGVSFRDNYEEEPGLQIAGWATYHGLGIPALGIGARVSFQNQFEIDPDDSGKYAFGSLLDIRARGDYGFSVATGLTIHLLGEVGIFLLFPDDDFLDFLDQAGLDEGSRLGYAGGLGAGVSYYIIDDVAIRGDLIVEWHQAELVNDTIGIFDYEMDIEGARGFLTLGVML